MGCISTLYGLVKQVIDSGNNKQAPGGSQQLQSEKPREPIMKAAGQKLPFVVEELGNSREADPTFVEIGRDGSGGGRINGKNIILFSDTCVRGIGPLTCTIAYSDDKDPASLLDFGGGGCPKQGIPYIPEEKEYCDKGNFKTRVAIWPQSSIAPVPGDNLRGIGIAPVIICSLPEAPVPSHELYHTLYTITAGDEPHVERTVPKMWHAGKDVSWGGWSTMLNPQDGLFYFFANEQETDNQGIKVARADPRGNYTDKNTWTFWTGVEWTSTPPAINAAKPIMPGKFSSGDIFWSDNLGTFMNVYFLHNVDSTFRYRYVLPDENGKVNVLGPWSEEFVLYETGHLTNGGCGFNYAGHAYPRHDPSGEWLVLSCTLSDGGTPCFFRARLDVKKEG